jgi:hypothetical protein
LYCTGFRRHSAVAVAVVTSEFILLPVTTGSEIEDLKVFICATNTVAFRMEKWKCDNLHCSFASCTTSLIKFSNEELHNLYSSPNIAGMVKSWRMELTGHTAGLGEKRNAYRFLAGKPEGETSSKN